MANVMKNYIGGEWVPSVSGEKFENLNPADTRDVVGRFARSTKEDVDHGSKVMLVIIGTISKFSNSSF